MGELAALAAAVVWAVASVLFSLLGRTVSGLTMNALKCAVALVLFLQTLLAPQSTIIKRELLWIPFFGWAFALNRPIAIDRSNPRAALRQLIRVGSNRLSEGVWVVLFPEGTRMPAGEVGRFQVGGGSLAAAADVPILVVAHNAGSHWPAHQLEKRPGEITVRIAPPIRPNDRDGKALTDAARATMAQTLAELPGEETGA